MGAKISQQGFKIGSRILDENELKVLLPSYDNIFNQIEKFREEAKKISEVSLNTQMNLEDRFDLKKDYNNIFSILGGRGTGKTSAAVTVRHRILNDSRDNDIIMPLIVPDDMGEISDVLGWIITYLGGKIKILVDDYLEFVKRSQNEKAYGNKYTQLYDKHCRKDQELDLNVIYRRVHKAYHFRKEAYQKILAQEYVGKNEYVNETKEALEADQNLIITFFLLIEEIIKVKSDLNNGKEPLIYFFFDDVDISAKRGPDVLSTTMRYLTHPNIVTFICGDYKVFSEMLTIDFLQKENLLDSGLMEKIYTSHDEKELEEYGVGTENTALNLRKVRGYDYLKKMLPSALRYEMPKLNNESKANFRYTKNNTPINDNINTYENSTKIKMNKELSLLQLLEKNFFTQEELENGQSFLKYKGNVVYSYFLIFDSTPRGLINPYYFLYQMLQDKERGINVWASSDIKQFLDIIISSSLVLGDYRELINKIIRIDVKADDKGYKTNKGQWKYSKIEYYIDYSYLESVFDGLMSKKDEYISKNNDDFCLLFILAHFFENILVVVNKKRNVEVQSLHGASLLCKILNNPNIEGNLYPQITNVNRLLYIHYLLTESISKNNSIKIFSNGGQRYFVWKYYDKVLKLLSLHEIENDRSRIDEKLLYDLFEVIFIEDRDWVKKKIRQMFEFGKTNMRIFLDKKMIFKVNTLIWE
jgi:DNA repair protein SbcC/Rad50